MEHINVFAEVEEAVFIGPERCEPVVRQSFSLKHQDSFLAADAYGDICGDRDGLFCDDTRVLSSFQLTFGGRAPCLLSSTLGRDNVTFSAHMTNRPLPPLGGAATRENVIHVERMRFLWQERLYERISFRNYGSSQIDAPLSLSFAADFHDIFEVRGARRTARGEYAPPDIGTDRVTLAYRGRDERERTCTIRFSQRPVRLEVGRADFIVGSAPGDAFHLYVEVGLGSAIEPASQPGPRRYRQALVAARLAMRRHRQKASTVHASDKLFNAWIDRSRADLALLTSDLPTGLYPYAGIPWFCTPFGRDGLIAALQTLWLDPRLTRGVLRYLAARQALETSTFRDAEPGKIMHETRRGEMCGLNELPFGLYYGGVDTTPLFVITAGAYADRTGDTALIDELWPALCRAIDWVEATRAKNADGFLTYARSDTSGLANQGWKDSDDSVFDAAGRFPPGPIALVEVQGYVWRALHTMSALAARRGDEERAREWTSRAHRLQAAIEEKYWMPQTGFYGMAIDGVGNLCEPRASNAGHLLFVGAVAPERARLVSARLLGDDFQSGWGIRTLAEGQARFNPMSYHNGSIWPHDTALCAAGMRRYGELEGAVVLLDALFEAAVSFGMRLPELFCGFARGGGDPPVGYPVACLPQAWAAGSALMLLQASLGLSIDGWTGTVVIDRPRLPSGVQTLALKGLQVGKYRLDLTFERTGEEATAYATGPAAALALVKGAMPRDA